MFRRTYITKIKPGKNKKIFPVQFAFQFFALFFTANVDETSYLF